MTFLTKQGSNFLLNKYGANQTTLAGHVNVLREEYTRLREALGGKDYLLGSFTYADIAMASSLQFLLAPPRGMAAFGEATCACATHPDLSREFADLGEWRDKLYDKHR